VPRVNKAGEFLLITQGIEMATVAQIHANRKNAKESSGPKTAAGKSAASANAKRHGLRSSRILLDDEDPAEFETLISGLHQALRPVGAVELALAERIAVTIWRQRRLIRAETSYLVLERRDAEIARAIEVLDDRMVGFSIDEGKLQPFDAQHADWCQKLLGEIGRLEEVSFTAIRKHAPLLLRRLESDAAEEEETLEQHVAACEDGLSGYVSEWFRWCQRQIREADDRPRLLALAEQLREQRLVLPRDQLEIFARYQTTLDNQLIKMLRAFREAQECRLKTLEAHTDT